MGKVAPQPQVRGVAYRRAPQSNCTLISWLRTRSCPSCSCRRTYARSVGLRVSEPEDPRNADRVSWLGLVQLLRRPKGCAYRSLPRSCQRPQPLQSGTPFGRAPVLWWRSVMLKKHHRQGYAGHQRPKQRTAAEGEQTVHPPLWFVNQDESSQMGWNPLHAPCLPCFLVRYPRETPHRITTLTGPGNGTHPNKNPFRHLLDEAWRKKISRNCIASPLHFTEAFYVRTSVQKRVRRPSAARCGGLAPASVTATRRSALV